jgi:leucyl-tRNA synthetase
VCLVDVVSCRRYPWDLRSSGKDLAYNHLPFALFNHVALFPRALWPRGIKVWRAHVCV